MPDGDWYRWAAEKNRMLNGVINDEAAKHLEELVKTLRGEPLRAITVDECTELAALEKALGLRAGDCVSNNCRVRPASESGGPTEHKPGCDLFVAPEVRTRSRNGHYLVRRPPSHVSVCYACDKRFSEGDNIPPCTAV